MTSPSTKPLSPRRASAAAGAIPARPREPTRCVPATPEPVPDARRSDATAPPPGFRKAVDDRQGPVCRPLAAGARTAPAPPRRRSLLARLHLRARKPAGSSRSESRGSSSAAPGRHRPRRHPVLAAARRDRGLDDKVFLVDLDSTNGTWIGDKRVTRVELENRAGVRHRHDDADAHPQRDRRAGIGLNRASASERLEHRVERRPGGAAAGSRGARRSGGTPAAVARELEGVGRRDDDDEVLLPDDALAPQLRGAGEGDGASSGRSRGRAGSRGRAASRSSASVTRPTTPSKKRISRSAFGCETGAPIRIAEAAVSPATRVTRSGNPVWHER